MIWTVFFSDEMDVTYISDTPKKNAPISTPRGSTMWWRAWLAARMVMMFRLPSWCLWLGILMKGDLYNKDRWNDLGTNRSYPLLKALFWVDDLPAFRFGGILASVPGRASVAASRCRAAVRLRAPYDHLLRKAKKPLDADARNGSTRFGRKINTWIDAP